MKARIRLIALVVSINVFADVRSPVNAVGVKPEEYSFTKYYEPNELVIEPNFPDYTLPLDVNNIVNFDKANRKIRLSSVLDLILQNGFAIKKSNRLVDFTYIYEKLNLNTPIFVTADTGLFLYHAIFDQSLRDIEERFFIQDVTGLTKALLDCALENFEQLDGDLKEAAKRNVAYLSVAQKIIAPNAFIPKLVDDMVKSELAKIEAHRGMKRSDIFKYADDYSQYVPRGHYNRSEELERYFKTMMWYGRMAFLLKGGQDGLISKYEAKIQMMQALLLATSLKNAHVGEKTGLEVWEKIYTVTAFFVGLADDLTPKEYLWALEKIYGSDFELSELADEDKMFALKKELALLPSPEIYGGTGNIIVSGPITDDLLNKVLDKTKGMRLMGRRFVPDSYIFQHLTFPAVGNYTGEDIKFRPFTMDRLGSRSYIRGLDLMAILGSDEALKILKEAGDTNFRSYDKRFIELTNEFGSLSQTDWNRNLYWSWLYSLNALLQDMPEEYPQFMRTQAWQRSRLNASLASWTQLRHDTILYGKQTSPPPPAMFPFPPGYVEPNPVFWGRLLSLTRMTRKGLEDFFIQARGYQYPPGAIRRLKSLEEILQKLLMIVNKQLTGKELSTNERDLFFNFDKTIEFTAQDFDVDRIFRTTLIADVHTVPVDGKVVEEGVGYTDVIVVACPLANGKAFLAAGPVFSYYEFKHPMSDRLTDEGWLKMLNSPEKPQRPNWYVPLMRQKSNPR